MPLPSPISKTNCDASTDDPKLALLIDLANAIDTINALISSVQPLAAALTTLSGISTTQANDLAALSTFMGTVLNDASAAVALATLGSPLNAVATKSAAYSVVAEDRGKLIDYTSGSYTLGMDPAATLGAGFVFAYRNSGSGTITLDPNGSEQIDGAPTLSVGPNESGFAVCNGTTWRTVGRTRIPGRTWKNLTGSRASTTTYTNSSGNERTVSITLISSVAGYSSFAAYVDGIYIASDNPDVPGGSYTSNFSFDVPNGSTYSVTIGGTASPSISKWFEFD